MPRNKSKTIPQRVPDSPSTSGFTFFGIPLSGINLNKILQAGVTRLENKKPVPVAERKNAIMNHPTSELPNKFSGNRNRPMQQPGQAGNQNFESHGSRNNYPPTIPEFQSGFIPILPGSGGFKPIPNPNLPPQPTKNTTQVQHNNRKSSIEINTSKPLIEQEQTRDHNFSSIASAKRSQNNTENIVFQSIPEHNITKKTATIELPDADTKIFETQTLTKSKITVLQEKEYRNNSNDGGGSVQGSKKFWTAEKRHHNVSKVSDVAESTTETSSTSTVLPGTTTRILTSTTTSITDISIITAASEDLPESTPLKQKENKQLQPNLTNPYSVSEKTVVTPLSTFLAPGGERPSLKNAAKSTITKVNSPHLEALQNSRPTLEVSDSLPQEKVMNNISFNAQVESITDKVSNENDWYFANYNKTNIEPYITRITNAQCSNNLDISILLMSSTIFSVFISHKFFSNIFLLILY